ncbi:MAG: polysaccharide biosynthesis C-terminal domain-containing protein [Clostridia bacterium]|nr:polysaccharide biosynthesis C-terminal domain-containing protein [Clostridia bacterium]
MHNPALLSGDIRMLILKIALPSMAAMIASSLCSLLDALLLGRGNASLSAAVSVSYALLTLIQTLGFTLGMGAGSFVSRCLGTGDKPAAYRAASTAFFAAIALSGALCAAGLCFASALAGLLGASGDILAPAAAYARYVLSSGPLMCASLVLSSLLRAQGHTTPNMLAFSAGAAAGIPLQLLLVPRLGIHGAGAAMLAREGVTLLALAVSILRRKQLIRPRLRAVSLRLNTIRDIMRSGLPTLLRQGLTSFSSVMLTRASAVFGEAALAGVGLSTRALSLISAAVIGFGQGFQPVCGAAYGAGRMDRVQRAYRFCTHTLTLSLLAAGAALFFLAGPLMSLFSPGEEVRTIAKSTLRAQSFTLFAQGAVIMMNMLTQAMGLTVHASLVATSRQGFVLIPLLALLPRFLGLTGLILCQSASDLISLALCLLITRGAIRDCACARGGYSDARKASQ